MSNFPRLINLGSCLILFLRELASRARIANEALTLAVSINAVHCQEDEHSLEMMLNSSHFP